MSFLCDMKDSQASSLAKFKWKQQQKRMLKNFMITLKKQETWHIGGLVTANFFCTLTKCKFIKGTTTTKKPQTTTTTTKTVKPVCRYFQGIPMQM